MGQSEEPIRRFKPRNTERCRELRREATPAERKLWIYLSKSQLGAKFSRQMQVGDYFPDFICRKCRLIVELEGFSHDIAPAHDVVRDRVLAEAGYRVLHFTNEDVYTNAEGVVEAIRQELKALAHP